VSVSFTLEQTTAVSGATYQVTNTVTAATDADLAVFVYITATQKFSHYAAVADMDAWPNSYELAQVTGAEFYRLPQLCRTWSSVIDMQNDLSYTLFRVQDLADQLTEFQGELVGTTTTVITGS